MVSGERGMSPVAMTRESILGEKPAEPGIEPKNPCSKVLCATD